MPYTCHVISEIPLQKGTYSNIPPHKHCLALALLTSTSAPIEQLEQAAK